MARAPQGPRLLLAIVGALVALTYQTRRKTFISVREVPASASVVVTTLDYVTKEFNKKSEDKYNFRVVRVPKVVQKAKALGFNIMETLWKTRAHVHAASIDLQGEGAGVYPAALAGHWLQDSS
ncbi:cystatin-11 [Camelus ferus]|nr:cystatin-11 [Camelus ferus]